MSELKDIHYLRAVTELGDARKIVANQDIYSQGGMKLVASGVAITSKLYERLVKHVLLKPLDMSLSTENMVDAETLWSDTQELIQENEKLRKVAGILEKGSPLRQTILAIHLPAPLAFKLTVAREKYSDIYQHSLAILIVSVYLAHCDGMSVHEEGYVATAALFHDIGLLHVDPGLLDPAHTMSAGERKHLYTHPLLAYLLLREFPELPRCIADMVLDHHERMDGRGYPRGLAGNNISRYAQILGIAEVSAKAFDPGSSAWAWQKLEVMLKLNSKQYGRGLIGFLRVVWDGGAEGEAANLIDSGKLVAQVTLIAKVFEDFERYADAARGEEIYDFAQTRLAGLRVELLDAGFDPRDPDGLIQRFSDDPVCMSEYAPLLEETLWQLRALVADIARRWAGEAGEKNTQSKKEGLSWLSMMELLLIAA